MNAPLTATAVVKMRQWAKQQARERAIPYSTALEEAARAAGFASWHEVRLAAQPRLSSELHSSDLPVDPVLPARFDDTPNELRSKAELDAWWLRPFAQSRGDGTFDVRCLDGGAWDRPTYYGTAQDLAQANEIARTKLASWQAFRDSPIPMLGGGAAALLILEPNRPGMRHSVLAAVGSMDDLPVALARWKDLRERDPSAYALAMRAARERSAQVPTDDQVEAALKRCGEYQLANQEGTEPEFGDVALLLTLHRFKGADAEVLVTLPELAHYLSSFGVDEDSIRATFSRVRQLQVGGRPAVAEASATVRDGVEHWRVRLAATQWPAARRRRKA